MNMKHEHAGLTRRDLLKALAGAGLVSALPSGVAHAAAPASKRILVVVELSGANDGLNTLVPYADDAYYRLRPKIGIRESKLRKIDDHYGFNASMSGFEKLYKDGRTFSSTCVVMYCKPLIINQVTELTWLCYDL